MTAIKVKKRSGMTLQGRHNERAGVLNHMRLDCLLRRRSKKTSLTGEFLAQRASNAENASIR